MEGRSVKFKQQDECRYTGVNRFLVTNPSVIETEDGLKLLMPKPITRHRPQFTSS
jgi:hypothetical protein